jgi:serine/threonine protein kinase
MGEVFLAQDTKLKRRVAIKVLPEAAASDPDRVARFHREAETVAALNHPGIAAIYDQAESGGTRFLVLELVEGETLARRLARGPLAVDEAVGIARQMLEALEAAHEKGICHRDLVRREEPCARVGGRFAMDRLPVRSGRRRRDLPATRRRLGHS